MNLNILEKLARQAIGGVDITSMSNAILDAGRITAQEHYALTSLGRAVPVAATEVSARRSGTIDGVVASKEWTDGWWC